MTDQECSHEGTTNEDEGPDRVTRCADPNCRAELARTRRGPDLD